MFGFFSSSKKTPVQSAPVQPTSVKSAPVQPTPVQSAPVQPTPVQHPVQATPIQRCSNRKEKQDEKHKKLNNFLKSTATTFDNVIRSAAKDLPIAKLYQIVQIGATIALKLNDLANSKLKVLLQTIIVKFLKIFNVYFFIMRAKIIAAKKSSESHNQTYTTASQNTIDYTDIYELDMTDVDNAIDDLNELNYHNPPSSFFSKTDVDSTILKFDTAVDKLSMVIHQALSRLTVLLEIGDDGINGYNDIKNTLRQTEEFKSMNSPIVSDDCSNMDFEIIFTDIIDKIKKLQNELIIHKNKITGLKKQITSLQNMATDLGCIEGQRVVISPGFLPSCAAIQTDKFDIKGGSKKSKRKRTKKNKKSKRKSHRKSNYYYKK